MKKILIIGSLLMMSIGLKAQSYTTLDLILDKLEARQKTLTDASSFDLINKKFVCILNFDDHDERLIVEFTGENTMTLIEVFDDKSNNQTYSNIFTGDFIRKKNIVSVRADKLEGRKIGMPLTYTFFLMKANNIWYLKDTNTSSRWIENKSLGKKK